MEANIEIAQSLFKQNQHQEAIDACKAILDTDSNSIEAIKLIAKSFLAIKKIDDARLYFDKALNIKPDDYEVIKDLGNTYQAVGDINTAKNYYQKAIEINSSYAPALTNLGGIELNTGNKQEAVSLLTKATESDPQLAPAWGNLANGYVQLGKTQEAEIACRKAIELNPNLFNSHCLLGSILLGQNKLQEAEISIRKAIGLNPNLFKAYFLLGTILNGQKKLKDAEQSFRKAIELKSDDAVAHSNLGTILIDLGKLQEAEISIRKSIEINPDFSEAHRGLSIYYYLIGNLELALHSIFKAYSLDPKDKTNKILLNIFKGENNHQERNLKTNYEINHLQEKSLDSNPLILNRPVEKKLIETLYKIKTQDQSKYQGPTYGNTIGSNFQLFDRNESMIKNIKDDLTSISMKAVKSDIFIVASFFTIFRSGGGLVSHDHLNNLDKIKGFNIASKKFSLVYYLSVGDQNCNEPGILKLEDPNQDILPHNGLIILFPAGRRHSVFYKGEKDRVIIGMNFYTI